MPRAEACGPSLAGLNVRVPSAWGLAPVRRWRAASSLIGCWVCDIHVLGGARLRRRSSHPCGPRARGCWLVLVGRVYARVHEWCSGRVRWQAPCNGIDLPAHKASHYRVPELVSRTLRRWLLCVLPVVWQLLDLRSPTLPTMASEVVGGALSSPHVPPASLTSGSGSARQVLPCSRVQCSSVVPSGCPLVAPSLSSKNDARGTSCAALPSVPCRGARTMTSLRDVTWLILPVVICLSQRLSHACVSMN